MNTVIHVGSGIVPIPPEKGGAVEVIIYEICKYMSKHGYEPVIFDNGRDKTEEGIRFVRIPVAKFPGVFLLRLTELLFGVNAARKISKLAKEKDIQNTIIHLHTVFTALPVILLRNILPRHTKVVYTSHNPVWTDHGIDLFNGFIREIEKFVVRNADCVTVGTKEARKKIIEKAQIKGDKIQSVYNFVDTDKFSVSKEKKWKKRKGINRMVLFVGKLIPNKGVEYLLRAIPAVTNQIKDVKFVIIGPASFESQKSNPWLSLVKELNIEGSVLFTGAVSQDELAAIYASADAFCFPTIRETFGVVLAEAMACGLPIVSSDIPVVQEVVDGAGILVPRRDAKSIAGALISVLSDRKLAKDLSKKAATRKRKFDKKIVLKDYINIYKRLSQ